MRDSTARSVTTTPLTRVARDTDRHCRERHAEPQASEIQPSITHSLARRVFIPRQFILISGSSNIMLGHCIDEVPLAILPRSVLNYGSCIRPDLNT